VLGQEDVLATALCCGSIDDGARWRQGRLYIVVLFDRVFELFDFGRLQPDNGIEVIDLTNEICSVEGQMGLRNVKAFLVHWGGRWQVGWCAAVCVVCESRCQGEDTQRPGPYSHRPQRNRSHTAADFPECPTSHRCRFLLYSRT
jgi:hypothetical protein